MSHTARPVVPYRVCLVCLGNICRSPIAEVVLRARLDAAGLADRVSVDSAGTGGWHVGDGADPRALHVLRTGGYDGSAHRARQVDLSWLATRDLVVAMDRENLAALRRLAGDDPALRERLDQRLHLLREWDALGRGDRDVPDPYYGGPEGFADVLATIERSVDGLVEHLRAAVG
jgi:protein-tyrosine phosphatase